MSARRFDPKLNKKRLLSLADFTIYTVNGLAVRNASRPDEEFGNFATHDEFPDAIGKKEVWVTEKLAAREGVFFAANALTYLARKSEGATDKAYDDGIAVERVLRERINGVEFRDGKAHKQVPDAIFLGEYLTLPDPKGPVAVRLVDGNLARSYYKTDYTQGGHGYVYPWVPKPQIWIENGVDHREIHFIVCHEYLEQRLMRDKGLDYDHAHKIASKLEFDLRKSAGLTPLLGSGHRKISKSDLPGLTSEEVFAFVLKNYSAKWTGKQWGRNVPTEYMSVLREAASAWVDDKATRLSAAVAFYTILSLTPLFIIAIAIAGAVFGQEAATGALTDQVRDLAGDAGRQIQPSANAEPAKPGDTGMKV
jgi:Virulence factor BrkB